MADKDLNIEVATEGDVKVVSLNGPLLLSNFFDFQALMRTDDSPALILDLSNVPFIDSAGIGALVNAQVSRTRSNRSMKLRGVNARVMSVFQITHVDTLFQLADDAKATTA